MAPERVRVFTDRGNFLLHMTNIDTSTEAVAELIRELRYYFSETAAATLEALDLKAREEGVRADFAQAACERIKAERDELKKELRLEYENTKRLHALNETFVGIEKERDEWRANAERLEALVIDSALVQVSKLAAELYGNALQKLGAPDNGDPLELLHWAERTELAIAAKDAALRHALSFVQDVGTEDPEDVETMASIERLSGQLTAALSSPNDQGQR